MLCPYKKEALHPRMRKSVVIATAVAIGLVIRIILLLQAPGLSYAGYDALIQVKHIQDTGLPLTHSPAFGGGSYAHMPLFYYLLAFFSILIPSGTVALWLPNILISLLPIPVYLLAKELTPHDSAVAAVTLASPFVPLLYSATVIDATPLTLAIPLLLLTYYYFIRLSKTPRDQTHFLIAVIALTFTHPIALILVPAMAFTVLLTRIQRTRFSHAMAEAAIFTAFLTIWANVIIYKQALGYHGLATLTLQNSGFASGVSAVAAALGVIPLLAGSYAAYRYLREERSGPMHAAVALALVTAALIPLRLIPATTGLLVLGAMLIVLCAPAIGELYEAQARSRAPGVYTAVLLLGIALFAVTSAVPAVASGITPFNSTVTPQDQAITQRITHSVPGATVLWDEQHGYYLEYNGLHPLLVTDQRASADSRTVLSQVSSLQQAKSDIAILRVLQQYHVNVLVLSRNSTLPLSERCFAPLYKNEMEVYHVQCVVQ